MVERRKALVVRSAGEVAVVYFTDSRLLDEIQIKSVGNDLYDIVEKQHRARIVISFQNVERFSTALLGKLVSLKKKAAKSKGDVKLCSIPPSIMEIFEVTGLDAAFDIFQEEQAAIKSFGRGAV